jgi:hypothetical protein
MPRAVLILHRKRHYDDGWVAELKLWRVPGTVRGSRHAFKYSLFYGRPGERLIGWRERAITGTMAAARNHTGSPPRNS